MKNICALLFTAVEISAVTLAATRPDELQVDWGITTLDHQPKEDKSATTALARLSEELQQLPAGQDKSKALHAVQDAYQAAGRAQDELYQLKGEDGIALLPPRELHKLPSDVVTADNLEWDMNWSNRWEQKNALKKALETTEIDSMLKGGKVNAAEELLKFKDAEMQANVYENLASETRMKSRAYDNSYRHALNEQAFSGAGYEHGRAIQNNIMSAALRKAEVQADAAEVQAKIGKAVYNSLKALSDA